MEKTFCSYCQKENETPVYRKLIFQDSKQMFDSRKGHYVWKKFVNSKTLPYCSEICAAHDQMAHEG
jgi:hypothetical protein